MIKSFGNKLTEDLFYDRGKKTTRSFPDGLRRIARRKLLYLHEATDPQDLRAPPGNRLERLKGELKGFYSIRVNDQWRLIFRFVGGQAYDVQIVDYHG